jgi:hypothetical protein
MSTIALVVGSLQKMPELLPVIEDLGSPTRAVRGEGRALRYGRRGLVVDARERTRIRPDTRSEGRVDAVHTTLADAMKQAAQ